MGGLPVTYRVGGPSASVSDATVTVKGGEMGAIDARVMHVLVRSQGQPDFEDVTGRVSGFQERGGWVIVTYPGRRAYSYRSAKVRIYDQVVRHDLARGTRSMYGGTCGGPSKLSTRSACAKIPVGCVTRLCTDVATAQ